MRWFMHCLNSLKQISLKKSEMETNQGSNFPLIPLLQQKAELQNFFQRVIKFKCPNS